MGRNRKKWGKLKIKMRRKFKNLEKRIRGYRTKNEMEGF